MKYYMSNSTDTSSNYTYLDDSSSIRDRQEQMRRLLALRNSTACRVAATLENIIVTPTTIKAIHHDKEFLVIFNNQSLLIYLL